MNSYLFKSTRLGFRNWQLSDLEPMSAINADPEVMRFFPSTLGQAETRDFIIRMKQQYDNFGFTYFATELLGTGEFIGFIGLSNQDFKSQWTPFIDIGWRLGRKFWGQGLATEGAIRVLQFGFEQLEIKEIFASAPTVNHPSIRLMSKIGMTRIGEFNHPRLADFPELEKCELFSITTHSSRP